MPTRQMFMVVAFLMMLPLQLQAEGPAIDPDGHHTDGGASMDPAGRSISNFQLLAGGEVATAAAPAQPCVIWQLVQVKELVASWLPDVAWD